MMNDKENTYRFAEEEAVITVIREEEPTDKKTTRRLRWPWIVLACIALAIALAAAISYYHRHYYIGTSLSISHTPKENIALLQQQPGAAKTAGVELTVDSIQSVALNIYHLRGLHGELSKSKPKISDRSVYLYMRSADYTPEGTDISPVVIAGEETDHTDATRLGYMATVGNKTIIGIARSNAVMDYAKDNGGHFFRQFILVSNGEIPQRFHLHKKVERRALASMDGDLYMVASRAAETMWDFAEALRKYGFEDAIYITGGDDKSFYRTSDGVAHEFGQDSTHAQKATWLVFRKNK